MSIFYRSDLTEDLICRYFQMLPPDAERFGISVVFDLFETWGRVRAFFVFCVFCFLWIWQRTQEAFIILNVALNFHAVFFHFWLQWEWATWFVLILQYQYSHRSASNFVLSNFSTLKKASRWTRKPMKSGVMTSPENIGSEGEESQSHFEGRRRLRHQLKWPKHKNRTSKEDETLQFQQFWY